MYWIADFGFRSPSRLIIINEVDGTSEVKAEVDKSESIDALYSAFREAYYSVSHDAESSFDSPILTKSYASTIARALRMKGLPIVSIDKDILEKSKKDDERICREYEDNLIRQTLLTLCGGGGKPAADVVADIILNVRKSLSDRGLKADKTPNVAER